MWCQSLDNLLQQLDPHLLPLTFVFPSQDSLLMQRKLSPTYLCEIGRCAKLPCLWGDMLLLDINVMLGGLRRCWYVIVWWLTEWSALWACCLTHYHSYLYQYHSLITVLPFTIVTEYVLLKMMTTHRDWRKIHKWFENLVTHILYERTVR